MAGVSVCFTEKCGGTRESTGENAFRTLIGLLEIRQRQAMTISADAVTLLLKSVPGIAALNVIDTQLVDNITGHLLRCVSAPVWVPEHRQSSMHNLKSTWPAAFDLSLRFIALLREKLDIPLFDSDLIGLYFACAPSAIKTSASRSFCYPTRMLSPPSTNRPLSEMF